MNSETYDHNSLDERLEKLQAQMRWMRRIGISAIALLFVLLLLFRVQSHRRASAERVVAKEFVLTDSQGRARARLAVTANGSGLEIYAPSGERRVQLIGEGEQANLSLYVPETSANGAASVNLFYNNMRLSSFQTDSAGARLDMTSGAGNAVGTLAMHGPIASLTLTGAGEAGEPLHTVSLEADASHACTALGGTSQPSAGSSLCLHSPGLPALELTDLEGNRAVLGITHNNADLSTQENSAASLVLRHKNGRQVHVVPR